MTRTSRRALTVAGVALLGVAGAGAISVVRTMNETAAAKAEAEALQQQIDEVIRRMPDGGTRVNDSGTRGWGDFDRPRDFDPRPQRTPCNCVPGDPLCSCLP